MDSYTFPTRDITDYLLAMKWIAATRPRNHEIVHSSYYYRIVTQPDKSFDRSNTTAQTRLFLFVELLKLLSAKILRNDVARNQLSVSDAREQVFYPAITVLTGNALHFIVTIAKKFLR
jgi:hypothetical protein